jgi:zinc protease
MSAPTNIVSVPLKRWKTLRYPPLRQVTPPTIEEARLPSGARLFVITDREFPVVELDIRLPWGNRDEPADRVGLCDILDEALRSGGSRRFPGDALDEALDDIGASLEIDSEDDFTTVHLFVLKDHLNSAVAILQDLLENPCLPEQQVETARAQVLGEIYRRNDEPEQIAEREFDKIIFGDDHPYARVPEIYTVQAITRDEIAAFYESYQDPSRILIGASGDVEIKELESLVQNLMGGRSGPYKQRPPLPPPPGHRASTVNFIQKDELNQSYIVIGHLGMMRDAPDYAAYSLWHRLLSGPALSGRLFSVVRSQMGLAYSVFSKPGAEYGYPGIFHTFAATRPDATVTCVRAILSQIELLREGNFSDDEFALAQDATLNSFIFYYASPAQIMNRRLDYEIYGYPPDFLERLLAQIPGVTREEATAAGARHIHPENFQFLVVGNRTLVQPFIDSIAPVVDRDITIRSSPHPE